MHILAEHNPHDISEHAFAHALEGLIPSYKNLPRIAVGVSGGPDSMALVHLLRAYGLSIGGGPQIHAITVDHNLRDESAQEARSVGAWLADLSGITHAILTRDKKSSSSKILESAREDRYAMLSQYCKDHSIEYLCLAHHQDDQAETFLLRLAKGSGVNGLAGMAEITKPDDLGIYLVRPLLHWLKKSLVDYCNVSGISYVQDPSNENEAYARPRLRAAQEALAREGLHAGLLSRTASRMARARDALEYYTDAAYAKALIESHEKTITFDMKALAGVPEEIILRLLLRALSHFDKKGGYGPRMDRAEMLCQRILYDKSFTRATLSGAIISLKREKGILRLEQEAEKA